jgi:hypothetical protein
MTRAELCALHEIAVGQGPLDIRGEGARVSLRAKGFAWRDEYYPWEWHLTSFGQAALEADQAKA